MTKPTESKITWYFPESDTGLVKAEATEEKLTVFMEADKPAINLIVAMVVDTEAFDRLHKRMIADMRGEEE